MSGADARRAADSRPGSRPSARLGSRTGNRIGIQAHDRVGRPDRADARAAQRGMAIIAALLVVIAAAALATSVIQRQSVLADVLRVGRSRAQADWLLRGGLDWSRVILQKDARDNPTTRLDGLWATPIADLPVGPSANPDQALFSGQIEDAQGKFNLRNLANGGNIDARELASLQHLLQWLNLEPGLAEGMAARVAAAQPLGGRPPQAVGLQDIDDLRAMAGFTPQVVDALQPYLTYIPVITPVNANTAPAEVLGAVIDSLGLAGARELVAQRDRGQWFVNHGDFVNRVPKLGPGEAKRIAVRSDWFRVAGTVTVDGTIVSLRALLHRDKEGSPEVRWIRYQ